jgi:hypothetical protein
MANRFTTHILKNSNIPNRPLPSTLLAGEPIVNTADGIVYFSGVTASASNWVPAGTGTTATFFEVGSNLYDLQLRNRITKYEDVSGSGLVGKFLSGTTNGFVLADISSIAGVDSYVTGGTYNALTDSITLTLTENKPNVVITGITDTFTTGATLIGSTAYFDNNSTLSAYTLDLSTFISTGDTYVTGFTYNDANTLTIDRNQGLPSLSVNINTMTGLTVNGTLSATTIDSDNILSGGTNLNDIFSTTDYYTTGATLVGSSLVFDRNDTLSAFTADLSSLDVNDTFVTGGTYSASASTLAFTNNSGGSFSVTGVTAGKLEEVFISSYSGTRLRPIDTTLNGYHIEKSVNGSIGLSVINNDETGNGAISTISVKATGPLFNNNTSITHFGNNYFINYLRGHGALYSDKKLFLVTANNNDIDFRTGIDLTNATSKFNIGSGGTLTIGVKPTVDNTVGDLLARKSDGTVVIVEKSGLTDTFVTGFTYNPSTNTFTISQNNGVSSLDTSFDTVSGLSISNLTANRLVYTTTGGELITGNAIFDGTDLTLPSTGSLTVGTGGLTVGSGGAGDLVVNGNLTILGDSISAFTSQLYVEDNNVILNYNPTGNTTITSVGAGFTIQDGNGVVGENVTLEIRPLDSFTGLTATEIPDISEYSGPTGYSNRGFVTQLNDIVIRSTDSTIPNGVRVLTEFDVLDGGSY